MLDAVILHRTLANDTATVGLGLLGRAVLDDSSGAYFISIAFHLAMIILYFRARSLKEGITLSS